MSEERIWIFIFAGLTLLSFSFFALLFWIGWRITQKHEVVSPYTGLPLRRLSEVSYYSAEQILGYLYDLKQYDNRVFKVKKAAFSRETGHIFQDCITIFDTIKIDWSFLRKRYPGNWVSWGSLNTDQQEAIRRAHHSLDGFQTLISSPNPSPRMIDSEYAYAKPGPLYVDLETKILLGWKVIPNTEFEVLIVQKPKNRMPGEAARSSTLEIV